jgi:HSP20 family protein
MLTYWDPFAEISRVHDRFFGRAALDREYTWKPAVDIYEDGDGVHVKAEVPGVNPDDIRVGVENGVLTISGERKLEHEDKREGYHRVERFYGTFSRSFALGDDVDAENIDARYDKGVLNVTLRKRPAAKKREIAVKAA